jgi:hypothetical protein
MRVYLYISTIYIVLCVFLSISNTLAFKQLEQAVQSVETEAAPTSSDNAPAVVVVNEQEAERAVENAVPPIERFAPSCPILLVFYMS